MVRRKLGLLIPCLAACCGSGCITEAADAFLFEPSLPVRLHLQEAWGDSTIIGDQGIRLPSERSVIFDCVAQWNEMVRPRLKEGQPLPFELGEFYAGDEFTRRDLVDGLTVLYRMPDVTPAIAEIVAGSGASESLAGYGLSGSDGFVFISRFSRSIGYDPTTRPPTETYPEYLRATVCHELGHLLGVNHQSLFPGTMNETIPWPQRAYVREADAEAFCLDHQHVCR